MFYLSEYLESNREVYYERLQGISRRDDWNSWIMFFLEAITHQATSNAVRVKKILALYESMKRRIADLTHSQHALAILDALFDRPILQTTDFIARSGVPKPTAMPALRKLRDAGILVPLQESSGRRPAILAFRELLNLAEGREVL